MLGDRPRRGQGEGVLMGDGEFFAVGWLIGFATGLVAGVLMGVFL